MGLLRPRETTIPAPYVFPTTGEFGGVDGRWSTFGMSVGTPGQDFRILPSTSGSTAIVPVPEGCTQYDPSDCAELRGVEPFAGAGSPGFSTNQSTTWKEIGLYDIETESRLNYTAGGLFGYDTLRLGPSQNAGSLSIDGQAIAGVADKDYFLGSIGLGMQPTSFSTTSAPVNTLMYNLFNQSKIPSMSYGYQAGAAYRFKSVPGSLVLGGYDSSRFEPSNVTFTMSDSPSTPLTLGVQSIIGMNTLLGTASMTPAGTPHLTVIDSTVSELWLPQTICDRFEQALGLIFDNQTGLYLLNQTMHSRLVDLNPTFTFKLGNQPYSTGNDANTSTNIILPYAAFDLTIGWPIYNTPNNETINYFPIRRGANETQYTLGRTLLQEAYLIVDYESQNFSISQATFSDPMPAQRIITIKSTTGTTDPSQDSPSSGGGISTGAIVGIVIGIIALIALAGAFLFLRRRRKRQSRVPELANTETKPALSPSDHSSATTNPLSPANMTDGTSTLHSPGTPGVAGYYAHDHQQQKPQELGATQITEMETPGPKTDAEAWALHYRMREARQGARMGEMESPMPSPSPYGEGRQVGQGYGTEGTGTGTGRSELSGEERVVFEMDAGPVVGKK